LLVARPVTLVRGPGVEQHAINREVILGQQPTAPRLLDHLLWQHARRVRLQQPLAVPRERGRAERLYIQFVEVRESLEQQVVAQLLAELALRADRAEGHHEARLEQVLGRDRRPPGVRADLIEQGRHPPERRVGQGLDLPQRVVLQVEAVWRQPQHHPRLWL